MTKKKKIITTITELNFCKLLYTKEEFYEKCELSTDLTRILLAKKVNLFVDNTDRKLTSKEMQNLGY
jgi:hypothetical protein